MSTAADRGQGEAPAQRRRAGGATAWRLTGVGDHHQDAVGTVFDNVGDDELEDVDVALNQVEPALALLLPGSRRHHHHLGISRHAVVCKMDRFSMRQIRLWGL